MGKGWPSRPSGVVGPNFAITKICVAICLAELGTRMVMMIKWTEGEIRPNDIRSLFEILLNNWLTSPPPPKKKVKIVQK